MGEFKSEIGGVATEFAKISSKATASANMQKLRTASGNISAATNQIELEKTVGREAVARKLAQFQGEQAAARAFRGGGSLGTGFAVADAATAQAADSVAVIEANAANKEIAVVAANQVQLDDPVMAAIQGGIQGMNIGTQIANSLISEAKVSQMEHNFFGPTASVTKIESFLDIKGLDIGSFFDIEGFMKG